MLEWCGFCSVRWLTVSLLCRSFRLTLAIRFVANLQQRNRYRAMVSIVEWARQYLVAFVWQPRPHTNYPNHWLAARNFWLDPVNTAKTWCDHTSDIRIRFCLVIRKEKSRQTASYLEKLFNVLQHKEPTVTQIWLTRWANILAGHIYFIEYTAFLHFGLIFAGQVLAKRINHTVFFTTQRIENQNAWPGTCMKFRNKETNKQNECKNKVETESLTPNNNQHEKSELTV